MKEGGTMSDSRLPPERLASIAKRWKADNGTVRPAEVWLLLNHIKEVEGENFELNRLFEIQQKRMGEATALWRKAQGPEKEFTLPDLGDLLGWLMDRALNAEKQLDEAIDDNVKALEFQELYKAERDEALKWVAGVGVRAQRVEVLIGVAEQKLNKALTLAGEILVLIGEPDARGVRPAQWSKERLHELADAEDGCDIGVGGLAVDMGLYRARTEDQNDA